jgi:Mg2+-importing ATPase
MSSLPSASGQGAHGPSVTWVGLTSHEAEARLAEYGPNDPASTRRGAFAFELLHLFLNPLVIILLVASVISAFLGEKIEAELIFIIVIFSIAIDFVQTYRSQRAIQRLQEHVSLTATTQRDGRWQEIKRHEIVPGDIVRLSAGDLVPADGQLLEARDLYVQQAALTGESMPAEKEVRAAISAFMRTQLISCRLPKADSDAIPVVALSLLVPFRLFFVR